MTETAKAPVRCGLSGTALKYIACITMLIDQEKGKVKGYFAQKAEQQKPPDVFFYIVGVQKALHGQKAEDGKGQPPDIPQHTVCRHKRFEKENGLPGWQGLVWAGGCAALALAVNTDHHAIGVLLGTMFPM